VTRIHPIYGEFRQRWNTNAAVPLELSRDEPLLMQAGLLFSWPAVRALPADRAPRWPTQGAARQLPVAVLIGGEVLAHGFAESARVGPDEC
jgi:hypothetical protein